MDDMLIDGLNLNMILSSKLFLNDADSCKDILRELIDVSEKYDVIIDNGKVILSEKS